MNKQKAAAALVALTGTLTTVNAVAVPTLAFFFNGISESQGMQIGSMLGQVLAQVFGQSWLQLVGKIAGLA
jgi:hypothetical protein